MKLTFTFSFLLLCSCLFAQVKPKVISIRLGCDTIAFKEVISYDGSFDRAHWVGDVSGIETLWEYDSILLLTAGYIHPMEVFVRYEVAGKVVAESNRYPLANNCPTEIEIYQDSLKELRDKVSRLEERIAIYQDQEPIILPCDTIYKTETKEVTIFKEIIKDTCYQWQWDFGNGFTPLIIVYPNPAEVNKTTFIEVTKEAKSFTATIYNALGVKYSEHTSEGRKVAFTLPNSGTWFIRLEVFSVDGRSIYTTKKLIIQEK